MRKSRFTESQIVDILKQGEGGVPVAEILLSACLLDGEAYAPRSSSSSPPAITNAILQERFDRAKR